MPYQYGIILIHPVQHQHQQPSTKHAHGATLRMIDSVSFSSVRHPAINSPMMGCDLST